MIELRWAAGTDVGRVRLGNEDAFLANGEIFAVCDGLGGHEAGEVASQKAVDILAEGPLESTREGLVSLIEKANRSIFEQALSEPERRGMGTTVTALAKTKAGGGYTLALANVGDSRCYRLREGEFAQLTTDHSLVQELVSRGHLTEEQARTHPQRSVITRALGLDMSVEVDSWSLELQEGDRFILCSDGLSGEVADSQIASLARRFSDPEELTRLLIAQANKNRGADNITVVVVDVEKPDEDAVVEASDEPLTLRSKPVRSLKSKAFSTFNVLVFSAALALLIAIGAFFVNSYVNSYTLSLTESRQQVVLHKGPPGGFLWFKETEIARWNDANLLNQEFQVELRKGVSVESENKATIWMAEALSTSKQTREAQLAPSVSATSSSTTTTTLATSIATPQTSGPSGQPSQP